MLSVSDEYETSITRSHVLDIEERSPIIDDIGPTLPTYKYIYIIYMSVASILRSCDCGTRHLDIFLSQCFRHDGVASHKLKRVYDVLRAVNKSKSK